MIGSLLSFVADQLNEVICLKLGLPISDKKLILSPIVNADTSSSLPQKNVLLLDLVNIKKDNLINSNMPTLNRAGTKYEAKTPPLYLNLDILIAAYFEAKEFKSGLDVLSMVMAVFQGKPLWNHSNTPSLPKGVDKLIFEIVTLDFHEQSHLWGYIGAKYMPSVVYKMRMAIIDDERITGLIPPITEITVETSLEED